MSLCITRETDRRRLERVADNPLTSSPGERRRLNGHLAGLPLVHETAHARVFTLGVLSDDEHIDVVRLLAR